MSTLRRPRLAGADNPVDLDAKPAQRVYMNDADEPSADDGRAEIAEGELPHRTTIPVQD